jgi:hypothetical protein
MHSKGAEIKIPAPPDPSIKKPIHHGGCAQESRYSEDTDLNNRFQRSLEKKAS